MISFNLDNQLNATVAVNDKGYATLATVNYPESISQNVKLRLLVKKRFKKYEPSAAIDWLSLISNPKLKPVAGTLIKSLVLDSYLVTSVDLSESTFSLNPPKFHNLCFTIDCHNKELSL